MTEDPFLTPAEVAGWLRVSVRHLANLRSRGGGPNFSKLGATVRYRKSDVLEWVRLQNREVAEE